MKAIIDIMLKLSHLFEAFQFMGLSGSSSPSQLTTLDFGFSSLLLLSPISSSIYFSPAVVVGKAGAEGKVAAVALEVDICVVIVLNEPQVNE